MTAPRTRTLTEIAEAMEYSKNLYSGQMNASVNRHQAALLADALELLAGQVSMKSTEVAILRIVKAYRNE